MTRNLKALGLALVAVFALGAISASSAMAATEPIAHFTSIGGKGKITGSQIKSETSGSEKHIFKVGSLGEITCNKAHFKGTEFTETTTSLTVEPEYAECEMHTFLGQHRPATVTMNGCYYTFTVHEKGTTHEGVTVITPGGVENKNATVHTWTGDVHILCPPEKSIEIHVYKSKAEHEEQHKLLTEGKAHGALCTYTVPAQTIKNIHYAVITFEGKSTYTTVEAKESETEVKRISGTTLNCGGEKQTAKYTGNTTVETLNEKGEMIEGTIKEAETP